MIEKARKTFEGRRTRQIEDSRRSFNFLHSDVGCQLIHSSILDVDLHGFDVVVSFFALHFLKNKQELTKVSLSILELLY